MYNGANSDSQNGNPGLNLMNSNVITAVSYVSGPVFGKVTDILPLRTLRGGVTVDF